MYVDMHSMKNLQTGFDATEGLEEKDTKDHLAKQGITFSGWNYTDSLVDENVL